MIKKFSSREERMVDILMGMDLNRSLARTIVFFSRSDRCVCRDIQKVTRLRQPEVSMAMHWLKEKKWIMTESLPRERKGRPIISYRLTVPFDLIINTLIRDEQTRIRDLRNKVNSLKNLLK